MSGKEHRAIGIVVTIPLIIYTNIGLIAAIAGLIGSTAPDWDLKLKFLGIRHRTITHSFIALFITTFICMAIDCKFAIVWFINYFLHLVADSTTPMGVPYFYPYKRKRYRL